MYTFEAVEKYSGEFVPSNGNFFHVTEKKKQSHRANRAIYDFKRTVSIERMSLRKRHKYANMFSSKGDTISNGSRESNQQYKQIYG